MKNNIISIISQAFYGNRTSTEIEIKNIDRFILGYQDDSISLTEDVDRSVIHVPESENVVLIYNKYEEEAKRRFKERAWNKDQYEIKPLATIPEIGLEIYSRCIACRINTACEFESIHNEDLELLKNYLAE